MRRGRRHLIVVNEDEIGVRVGGRAEKSETSLVTNMSSSARVYGRISDSSLAPSPTESRTCAAWIPSFPRYEPVFGSTFSSRRNAHSAMLPGIGHNALGTIE